VYLVVDFIVYNFVICISLHNFVLCNLAVFLYSAIETIGLSWLDLKVTLGHQRPCALTPNWPCDFAIIVHHNCTLSCITVFIFLLYLFPHSFFRTDVTKYEGDRYIKPYDTIPACKRQTAISISYVAFINKCEQVIKIMLIAKTACTNKKQHTEQLPCQCTSGSRIQQQRSGMVTKL